MVSESIKLAVGNIGRTKLRHFLTMCGIMIGIGAIVSMVSYAVGMRNEMSRTVASSGLLTTIYVLPSSSAISLMAPGMDEHDPDDSVPNKTSARETRITDDTIARIVSIKGVTTAFPIVVFPAIVSRGSQEAFATIAGIPSTVNEATRKRLEKGEVFSSENDSSLLASPSLARRLRLRVDSIGTESFRKGIPVTVTIAALGRGTFSPLAALGLRMPFERKTFRLYLRGVLKEGFFGPTGRADGYVPLKMAKEIASVAIQDPSDILRHPSIGRGGYLGAEVRASSLADVENVTNKLKAMNLTALSISDQLKEMRTAFVLMSAFLGAIGGVALFVGCLGIVNVMLISVLERTREIGIMKSVGATRKDILNLFVAEAALIGLVGGVLGTLLGWLVAEVTNHVMFAFVIKGEVPFRRLYEIPFWLSAGAVGLAVAVSVLAGLYPARRAAGLEPTAALRYE